MLYKTVLNNAIHSAVLCYITVDCMLVGYKVRTHLTFTVLYCATLPQIAVWWAINYCASPALFPTVHSKITVHFCMCQQQL